MTDPPPAAPVTLDVISWNVHGAAGDPARLLDDVTAGRLTGSPPRDYIVLLQESTDRGPRGVADLATARNLSFYFGAVREAPQRAIGNAIVSSLPLSMPRQLTLPRERQPRGAVMARVRIAGTEVTVANAHFENRVSWWRGGLFSEGARRRQADALVGEIPEGPAIVGGDFNTWLGPAEPAWRLLMRRFPDTPEAASPSFRDRLFLDHVFLDLPDGWQVEREVPRNRYGSDHNPVVVRVRTGG